MFLRSNLRLKIGLIIIKVNSNYINGGTWLAAVVTEHFPIRASTDDCFGADDANSHQLPLLKAVCCRMCVERSRAKWY